MSKKSTLKLQNLFLKEECTAFDKTVKKNISTVHLAPNAETIHNILAYASSVKGIKMKSNDKILISLN